MTARGTNLDEVFENGGETPRDAAEVIENAASGKLEVRDLEVWKYDPPELTMEHNDLWANAAGGSGGEVGSLEPGDFVTLDTGDNRGGGVQGGWSPVKPLYFCRNDSKQRRQWVSRAGSRKIGWVAQNDSADQPPPLRSCMRGTRLLRSGACTLS